MNYKLNITKTEQNINYADELKQWQANNLYSGYSSLAREIPQSQIIKDVLLCELTEEQYRKVKAEVFKVFE